MNKLSAWLFRPNLELNKHWWHRLIKVVFFVLLFGIIISAFIDIALEQPEEYLSRHNIKINNSLLQFTETYTGSENENTIPAFFRQAGHFGYYTNRGISPISQSQIGHSICIEKPENHQDVISKALYEKIADENPISWYRSGAASFTKSVTDYLEANTGGKCHLFNFNPYGLSATEKERPETKIVNFRPNFVFYLELIGVIAVAGIFLLLIGIILYYRVFLYIFYGNK